LSNANVPPATTTVLGCAVYQLPLVWSGLSYSNGRGISASDLYRYSVSWGAYETYATYSCSDYSLTSIHREEEME
jgi:hypothetical protein